MPPSEWLPPPCPPVCCRRLSRPSPQQVMYRSLPAIPVTPVRPIPVRPIPVRPTRVPLPALAPRSIRARLAPPIRARPIPVRPTPALRTPALRTKLRRTTAAPIPLFGAAVRQQGTVILNGCCSWSRLWLEAMDRNSCVFRGRVSNERRHSGKDRFGCLKMRHMTAVGYRPDFARTTNTCRNRR